MRALKAGLRVLLFAVIGAAFLVSVPRGAVAETAAPLMSMADLNSQIDATNLLVNDGCSGTVIDAKAQIVLTATHCVENQYETIEREKVDDNGVVTKEKVRRFKDGTVSRIAFAGAESVQTTRFKVRLVAVSRARDLALLKVVAPMGQSQAVRMACAAPVRGDSVFVVGNPMGVLYASLNTGIVTSVQRDYGLLNLDHERQPLLQTSAGIVGGNSGGAVLTRAGDLIGVPVLGHRLHEVIGFAAPLEAIKAFLLEQKMDGLFAHCAGPKSNEAAKGDRLPPD